jgi:hypothetical protein
MFDVMLSRQQRVLTRKHGESTCCFSLIRTRLGLTFIICRASWDSRLLDIHNVAATDSDAITAHVPQCLFNMSEVPESTYNPANRTSTIHSNLHLCTHVPPASNRP